MSYDFTVSREARVIHVADTEIDTGRLIAFARGIEPQFPGSYGDDNEGGFCQERRPSWTYRLEIRGERSSKYYRVEIVKLRQLQHRGGFAVVAEPEDPCPIIWREKTLPELTEVAKCMHKHTGSQLPDGYFRLGRYASETWIVADRPARLDSSLLISILRDHQHAPTIVFSAAGDSFRVQQREHGLILTPYERGQQ